jgi:hypothetical protein
VEREQYDRGIRKTSRDFPGNFQSAHAENDPILYQDVRTGLAANFPAGMVQPSKLVGYFSARNHTDITVRTGHCSPSYGVHLAVQMHQYL